MAGESVRERNTEGEECRECRKWSVACGVCEQGRGKRAELTSDVGQNEKSFASGP